jgi:pimeloyl-ACP methyl ester carboxylesterase
MDLLLLHGALGSKRQMLPLQQRVGGAVIDFTGHGERAIPPTGLTFAQFVEDIDRAYAANGFTKAHLFGYSMGGYAALLYAAQFPERVLSVATLGTKLVWTEEGLQKELRMLDPEKIEAKVPAFAKALADVHGADRWPTLVGAIAKSMSELAAAPLLTPEVCAHIDCQVLLCVGDEDTTAVPHDTRIFASGLQRANVHVLRGTRHPFESVDLNALEKVLTGFWGLAR